MGSSAYHAELSASCPDGWRVVPLPQVAYFQEGPGILAKDFVDGGVPLIRLKGVEGDFVTLDGCNFLDPEKVAVRWNHFRLDRGDLVISTSASFGRVSEVGDEAQGAIPYTGLIRFRPSSKDLEKSYLRTFLGSVAFMQQVEAMASGSVIRHFGPTHLKQMALHLPPLGEQRAIGEFSDLLANRLRLLRQANATLEAIAQALFKSWFVDFDPVRAKAEGREPEGVDAATAVLFPDRFEGSDLGQAPAGWGIASLQEHITAERGLSYKGAGLSEHGVPMHNLNSVLEGGGYKYPGIKHYRGDYKDRHVALPGDIIVANTEQGHHHRLIGFPAIVPASFEAGIYSHHLYRVQIKEGSPLSKEWLYRGLMIPAVRDQIIGCANGSTVNMLKLAGLQIPKFVVPPSSLCAAFDHLAIPIRKKVEANVERINNLSLFRDTLLPRLISGKLRLPEVEREIESAIA